MAACARGNARSYRRGCSGRAAAAGVATSDNSADASPARSRRRSGIHSRHSAIRAAVAGTRGSAFDRGSTKCPAANSYPRTIQSAASSAVCRTDAAAAFPATNAPCISEACSPAPTRHLAWRIPANEAFSIPAAAAAAPDAAAREASALDRRWNAGITIAASATVADAAAETRLGLPAMPETGEGAEEETQPVLEKAREGRAHACTGHELSLGPDRLRYRTRTLTPTGHESCQSSRKNSR